MSGFPNLPLMAHGKIGTVVPIHDGDALAWPIDHRHGRLWNCMHDPVQLWNRATSS